MSGQGAQGEPAGSPAAGSLPPEAFAAALAGLPGMGPARLAAVLQRWDPCGAWQQVAAGTALRCPAVAAACRPDPAGLGEAWRRRAASTDVASTWEAYREAAVGVWVLGRPGYPELLADDHEAPAVLFTKGNSAVLQGRRVAIVGTRTCTRYGRDVAYELGRDLAANGVRVVSGLALGIDGAAHAGALAAGPAGAPPVAVVGSGLDVIYPWRHRKLWAEVAEAGLVLSEAPLGGRPEPWRFPVRNRVIAALAEVVVVVESFHTGGSRHTVDAAVSRSRPVLAVPGPVRSQASELPNGLLAEGCHPARDATDVLVALGLCPTGTAAARGGFDSRPPPSHEAAAILEVVGWEGASFESVVLASGRSPAEVSLALIHLERDGWVTGSGGWWERASSAG
ncbi:MAG: DNA-protecting protein DprA [Actinomycetota bacterium]|nr:DNA-protecting protein DprA [Actinomycetota bacterium]